MTTPEQADTRAPAEKHESADADRKNLAARLRASAADPNRSRSQLEAVFQAMSDGVVVSDMEGNFVVVNEAEAAINGFASAEDMKRSLAYFARVYELAEPDGRVVPVAEWPLSRVLRGESLVDWELRGRRLDTGREWFFSFSGEPVFDAEGKQVLAVTITRDITRRKHDEEVLRESEERFRTLADNIAQLAWMADDAGRIFWYNERWLDYTGTTLDEMNGSGWRKVHHPDHVRRVVEKLQRCFAAGEVWEDTFPLRRRDGAYRWFLSRAIPIRDAQGKVLRWFGTHTDITEQRDAEEALREAARQKDQFLAMLAHELRNPLAAISGAAHLARVRLGQGQNADRPLAILERQIRHSARLLDDLLDVGRLTHGRIQLRKEQVRLDDVVMNAAEAQRASLDTAGHELAITVPREPVFVEGDPTRLEQIVTNLLNNAAKFTPDRGRIGIVVEAREGEVLIKVSDNGVGIPAELLPRVFDLFTQGDRSVARTQGGLGIGLALVRTLVEMHGGSVEARSEVGKGSEFLVRLPSIARRGQPRRDESSVSTRGGGARTRILVVEDVEDTAELTAEYLASLGYDVTVAHDGPAALEAAARTSPEIVLLDIGLPGMDGYEVARRLREDGRGGAAVLIALTGYGQEEDRKRSREAGFAHHLTKPFEPAALERLLAGISRAEP